MRIVPVGTHEYNKFIAIDKTQQLFRESKIQIFAQLFFYLICNVNSFI